MFLEPQSNAFAQGHRHDTSTAEKCEKGSCHLIFELILVNLCYYSLCL